MVDKKHGQTDGNNTGNLDWDDEYVPSDFTRRQTLDMFAAGGLMAALGPLIGAMNSPAFAAADDEIPSIFSDKFDESMSEKWEASIPKWEKDMENADYAARWEKSLA